MARFSDTLSVVLPVYNVVSDLGWRVAELLDVLPDLTEVFEILIIDNGSTDRTEESAYELETQFPQVRVIRLESRIPADQLQALGFEQSASDYVSVMAENSRVSAVRLKQLWARRTPTLPGQETPVLNRSVVDNLKSWAAQLPQADAGDDQLRVIRRKKRGGAAPNRLRRPAADANSASTATTPAPTPASWNDEYPSFNSSSAY